MALVIDANVREILGKKNKKIRSEGSIPGVRLWESKRKSECANGCTSICKSYVKAGESTLVDLN